MINNVHIFICLSAILLFSLGKNLFNYLVTFIELLVFLLFYLKIACYVLSTCPLRCVLQIYQSVACFFITFIVLKNRQQVLAFSSVAQSCPTLCDPMNCSTPGLPVHHHLPEFTQIHVRQVSDAIQPSHSLSSPFLPDPNPSQH